MPLQLLEELEAAAPAESTLEEVEEHLRAVARLVAPSVSRIAEAMKGSAVTFQNAWRRIVLDVARGKTAEIQAARAQLLSTVEKRIRQLKLVHALATWLATRGEVDFPFPDDLLPEIASMVQLKTSVFDQWQSAEDLEDLAARDYPLTTADLERIGPQRRPPASWYAEEGKPF